MKGVISSVKPSDEGEFVVNHSVFCLMKGVTLYLIIVCFV